MSTLLKNQALSPAPISLNDNLVPTTICADITLLNVFAFNPLFFCSGRIRLAEITIEGWQTVFSIEGLSLPRAYYFQWLPVTGVNDAPSRDGLINETGEAQIWTSPTTDQNWYHFSVFGELAPL